MWFSFKKKDLAKLLGVNDSKKLTEKKRAELFPKIIDLALYYELVHMTPQEVNTLNVFQVRTESLQKYGLIYYSFKNTIFFLNYFIIFI